ncbi:MAG: FAD-dependent oxidoreductase [Gammaproteobacteria bacterium]|nr:FAD-dependent oxidoreductase [Gammaproteobacteria bacterium]
MTNPIVIIGTGLAGYTLARELRKRDKDVPLCLLTRDDGAFYSKPMLSNALSKQKTPDDLATADADKMRTELGAEILTQTTVTVIDTGTHNLTLANGKVLGYSKLIFAVGAKPITPPLQGDAVDRVCQVNSLGDYRHFRQRIADKKRVAIIGPGLIGCEFANDLISAGYAVHVIGPNSWPLGSLLPEGAGLAVQAALQNIGVHWHLGCSVQSVNSAGEELQLTLDNHERLAVDVVLSAIGLRANIALAQAAGLQVNRGVVVDRKLQASVTDVYAIGDCAEVEGLVLPFVMPIMHQARALAATLCAAPTDVAYPAMPVLVKTTSYPVVVSPPPQGAQGEWQEQILEGGVQAVFKAGDAILGFALTGTAVSEKQALSKQLPAVLP